MAWITPKTDWTAADMFTYEDANRITGNLNHIKTDAGLKDTYTQDDVITASEWAMILEALSEVISTTGYRLAEDEFPDSSTSALNFNRVEDLTQSLYNWIELLERQEVARIYSGDTWYASAAPENYARS